MRSSARIALPLVLSAALALPAAAETWERSFDITTRPELSIRTNDGSVQVDTWNRKAIGVRVVTTGWRIGSGGVTVDAHQVGDRVEVEARTPRWSISFGFGHSVRIEVTVPARTDLDIQTGDGSVTIRPLAGNIRARTGDGAISVSGLKGDVTLSSGDG